MSSLLLVLTIGVLALALVGSIVIIRKRRMVALQSTVPIFPVRKSRRAFWVIIGVLVLTCLACGIGAAFFMTTPQPVFAANGTDKPTPLGASITLSFDKPLDRNRVHPTIEPALEGEWRFEDSTVSNALYRTLVFTPARSFDPAQEYIITLDGIANVLDFSESTFTYTFVTQALPTIQSISLKDKDTGIGVCDDITVTLDAENDRLANFDFAFEPDAKVSAALAGDKRSYTLKQDSCFEQNAPYTLRISRSLTVYRDEGELRLQGAPELLQTLTFTTKPAPAVQTFAPKGTQLIPSETKEFSLAFDQPMEQVEAKGITVTPALSGAWSWKDATTLVFAVTDALQFETTYTVAVPSGITDARKGRTVESRSFSFTTIGKPHVTRISPRAGATAVAVNTPISVVFDQPVDHTTAEAAFTLSPSVPGTFSWSGNTMSYNAPLAKDSHYTVRVAKGVKSVHGLVSVTTVESSFATEESVTLLNISFDRQDSPLSCEVASLKMALAYKGISVSESALMDGVGFDTTAERGDTWGDPDQGFVGSITGRQNTTGYGVHWAPIARAARNYRSAQSFSGWSLSDATSAIAAGNPVVTWGVYPGSTRDSWVTPEGRTINTWKGEHVRVLIGFTGSASNPSRLIMVDPVDGRLSWSVGTFMSDWSAFGNSGVVVY
ncbi:MAG TPA: Ig-like domain-containing protein [Verrucomicrobiae bacterium]|nr:Ig-like domain-containing protein [Verrucomicrobiae bacterium]